MVGRRRRLVGFDYRNREAYFVTFVTKHRQCTLGRVVEDHVELSRLGQIVASTWRAIPSRFPDVGLDEWIVMPNHVHGLLLLNCGPSIERATSLPAVIGWVKLESSRRAVADGFRRIRWQASFTITSSGRKRACRRFVSTSSPIRSRGPWIVRIPSHLFSGSRSGRLS
jgi:REP element-mobilizing transposase RayT